MRCRTCSCTRLLAQIELSTTHAQPQKDRNNLLAVTLHSAQLCFILLHSATSCDICNDFDSIVSSIDLRLVTIAMCITSYITILNFNKYHEPKVRIKYKYRMPYFNTEYIEQVLNFEFKVQERLFENKHYVMNPRTRCSYKFPDYCRSNQN